MFHYRRASLEDLDIIWNKDIQENPNDERYLKWKNNFIEKNKANTTITFVVVKENDPVGQGSLVLDANNINFQCKELLCNGKNLAYISALRIEKAFEGQGHISKLIKTIESFAKEIGIKVLTIGVEAKETRNLAIYLHFGYTNFITSIVEDDELILFFSKEL